MTSEEEVVRCSYCDGEGYVLDRFAIAATGGLLGAVGWLMSDGDSETDIHKKKCGRCNGWGKVRVGK